MEKRETTDRRLLWIVLAVFFVFSAIVSLASIAHSARLPKSMFALNATPINLGFVLFNTAAVVGFWGALNRRRWSRAVLIVSIAGVCFLSGYKAYQWDAFLIRGKEISRRMAMHQNTEQAGVEADRRFAMIDEGIKKQKKVAAGNFLLYAAILLLVVFKLPRYHDHKDVAKKTN